MIIPPLDRRNESILGENPTESCSTSLLEWTWYGSRCSHLDRAFSLSNGSSSIRLYLAGLESTLSRSWNLLKDYTHQHDLLLTRDDDGPPHVPGDLSQNTQNGIIIGSVFAVLIVVFALFFWGQRRNIQLVLNVRQSQVIELEDPPERQGAPGDQPNPPDDPAPPGDGANVDGGENDPAQNRDGPAADQGNNEGQEAPPAEPAEHRAVEAAPTEGALVTVSASNAAAEAAPLSLQAATPVGEHEERVAASAARALARAAALEARLAADSTSSDDEHPDPPEKPQKRKKRSRRGARFARQVEIIQNRDEDG